ITGAAGSTARLETPNRFARCRRRSMAEQPVDGEFGQGASPRQPRTLEKAGGARPWSRRLDRVLDFADRAIVLSALAVFVLANYPSQRPVNLLIVASNMVMVWFVLFRRPARAISHSPLDWTL